MKILDLYTSILKATGLQVDKDGFISFVAGDGSKPITIDGKPLVLPNDTQLANGDWSNRVGFHPLMENILKGESEVLSKLRSCANLRLNMSLGILLYEMLVISTSVDQHAKLTPQQSEFLSITKTADERTLADVKKLLHAMPMGSAKQCIVNLYLKRGGAVGARKYARVGIVNFPLYEELTRKDYDNHVFGVKLRVKDRPMLIELLKFIFPEIDKPEAYNRGSDSKVAPYLEAFMHSFGAVAAPINDLVDNYKNVLDDPKSLEIDAEWVEPLEELENMGAQIRMIPKLEGNIGTASKAPSMTGTGAVEAVAPTPTPVTAPVAAAPAPVGAVDLPWNTQQPAQVLHQPQQVAQQPMAYPNGQMATQAPQTNVHTKGGLDFEALCRQNPVLAAQTGAFNVVAVPGAGMHQAQAPRWAQAPMGMMNNGMAGGMAGMVSQMPPGVVGYNQFGQPVNQFGQVMQVTGGMAGMVSI